MYLTDTEARKKRCPKMLLPGNLRHCLGSECFMAWRWREPFIVGAVNKGYCGVGGVGHKEPLSISGPSWEETRDSFIKYEEEHKKEVKLNKEVNAFIESCQETRYTKIIRGASEVFEKFKRACAKIKIRKGYK